MSSFVTSMLNPISDAGVESIFTTASSLIVSLQTPTPIMTPSTISIITTSSDAPIPSTTIPSIILKNLPTFNSAFCFDKRLRSLETSFSEYRQTNPFVDAVSAIPDEQQNLYKALVEAYDADKTILDTYGESTILKRRREDDDQEGPSAGSDWGQLSASESAFVEEPVQTTCQMEEPLNLMFETGIDDQPIVQTSEHPEWFTQPRKPPTPDRDWNKSLPATQGEDQSWISVLARQNEARSSFNELLDTPLDFSNFIMNRLGVDTLTPELLAGPTYKLMRGSCNSLTELEYHLEEVYKATTDQLDWINPEGQQHPRNLLQPLSLIPDNRGRCVIPFEHFINNDLEYLRGGASSHKYTTSVTKTKAADYGHIKWIDDLVPCAMCIQQPINYDRHALWGVSHWGENVSSSMGMQLTRNLLSMYTPRGGSSLSPSSRLWNGTTTSIWTGFWSIVIQRRVEDLQLGVKSYQKRLNLTKPDTYRPDLKRRKAYTAYSNPRGFIYQNKDKKNRLMRIDELYKFSNGTLNDVRNALDDRLKGIRMQYLSTTIWRRGYKDWEMAMI
nr:hypothetical protein [Tanacetum cinerariifolium]GFA44354.1 hypothetical protein [Tanacetum cinerariifolium]